MAEDNHTLHLVTDGKLPSPRPFDELDAALYDMSCGISTAKVLQRAVEGQSDLDWGIRDQAFVVCMNTLEAAYNRLDGAIMRAKREARSQDGEP